MNQATVTPISSPTLARATYERLRSDVLSGEWEPGCKLPMHDLRERYGVGASPLREALNRLASDGWVVHNDQRGFTVALATQEQLNDLVGTRIAVEGMALTQAFARRTAEWEEKLVLAFHRLSRTPRSIGSDKFEENPEWERLHRAFHLTLMEGCGSPLTVGFCEELYDLAYRYRQLAARKAYKKRNELDEHKAVFEAVLAGKLDEAITHLTGHYRLTAGFVDGPGATAVQRGE